MTDDPYEALEQPQPKRAHEESMKTAMLAEINNYQRNPAEGATTAGNIAGLGGTMGASLVSNSYLEVINFAGQVSAIQDQRERDDAWQQLIRMVKQLR